MTDSERIKQLEGQLHDARTLTYIGQTQSLYFIDGELHIEFDDDRCLVMDTEQLFKDLPYIITKVCEQQKETQDMHLKMIKDSIETL
jgi:hypothetical protein